MSIVILSIYQNN